MEECLPGGGVGGYLVLLHLLLVLAEVVLGAVHLEHVLCQQAVRLRIGLVQQQPQEVETRQQSGGQVDVVLWAALEVVAAARGVGGRQDRRSRVERGGDAALGDAHRLLLHGLVDCRSVLLLHFVKLINAADALRERERPPSAPTTHSSLAWKRDRVH